MNKIKKKTIKEIALSTANQTIMLNFPENIPDKELGYLVKEAIKQLETDDGMKTHINNISN